MIDPKRTSTSTTGRGQATVASHVRPTRSLLWQIRTRVPTQGRFIPSRWLAQVPRTEWLATSAPTLSQLVKQTGFRDLPQKPFVLGDLQSPRARRAKKRWSSVPRAMREGRRAQAVTSAAAHLQFQRSRINQGSTSCSSSSLGLCRAELSTSRRMVAGLRRVDLLPEARQTPRRRQGSVDLFHMPRPEGVRGRARRHRVNLRHLGRETLLWERGSHMGRSRRDTLATRGANAPCVRAGVVS